jgi:ArsR family transcriptional regulator
MRVEMFLSQVAVEKDRLARCIRAGMRDGSKGKSIDSIIRKLEDMGPDENAREAARKAKALSDPIRVAMVRALGREERLCVCELMHVISRSQPSTSHHLRILREAGIVNESRSGKWIFYTLADDSILKVLNSLQTMGGGA